MSAFETMNLQKQGYCEYQAITFTYTYKNIPFLPLLLTVVLSSSPPMVRSHSPPPPTSPLPVTPVTPTSD